MNRSRPRRPSGWRSWRFPRFRAAVQARTSSIGRCVPSTITSSHTLYDDDYESRLRPELRFLEPFRRAMPDSVARRATRSRTRVTAYLSEPRDVRHRGARRRARAAWPGRACDRARGAYARADAAARRVVSDVLDLPAGIAGAVSATRFERPSRSSTSRRASRPRSHCSPRGTFAGDSATREALAAVEHAAPALRAALDVRRLTRTRADRVRGRASRARLDSRRVRFVALQEAMRTGIPDGWARSIQDSVPPARWARARAPARRLAATVRALTRSPTTCGCRRCGCSTSRATPTRAWNELLAMYPRHRERVLGEMRYLVQQGIVPESLDDPRIDWPLRTALVPEDARDAGSSGRRTGSASRIARARAVGDRHAGATAVASDHDARRVDAVASGRLPAAGPRRRAPLWAKLRLARAAEAGDIDGAPARRPTARRTPSATLAAIRVRLHLLRHDWGRALAASPAGDPATRTSFASSRRPRSSTRWPPRGIAARERRAPNDRGTSRRRRRLDGASRSARTADPTSAQTSGRVPPRSRRDTSRAGRLAFARWMRDQHGRLFFGERHVLAARPELASLRARPATPPTARRRRRRSTRACRGPQRRSARRSTRICAPRRSSITRSRAYARWLDGATRARRGSPRSFARRIRSTIVSSTGTRRNSRFWTDALEPERGSAIDPARRRTAAEQR